MRHGVLAAIGIVFVSAARLNAADTPDALRNAPVGGLKLSGTALGVALARLGTQSGKPVFVNWRALETAGVSKTLPVTVDLSGLSLGDATDRLLAEVGGTRVVFGCVVDEGVLTVSTADDIAARVETRTIDVRPLLGPNDAGRAARVDTLLRRVRGTDPLSWKENGGRYGRAQELGGQLIVTQTPAVQRRVNEDLLPDLSPAERDRLHALNWRPPATTRPASAEQAAVQSAGPASPTAVTDAALAVRPPECRFEGVTLGDALARFEKQARVGVDVEWAELAKAGVTPASLVTARVRNATYAKVLNVLMDAAPKREFLDTADTISTAVLADGRVRVTRRRDLFARFATTEAYPVGDLVDVPTPDARPDHVKQLAALVRETVAPATWSASADAPGGAIVFEGPTMRVTQTAAAHERIAALLRTLHAQQRPQAAELPAR